MRLLLDTHVWLWLQIEPEKIQSSTLSVLGDRSNQLYLSAASSWEISIKWALGKLALPEKPAIYIPQAMARHGIEGVAIEHRHTFEVANLPDHHHDPFDRLLVAQARIEGLTCFALYARQRSVPAEIVSDRDEIAPVTSR